MFQQRHKNALFTIKYIFSLTELTGFLYNIFCHNAIKKPVVKPQLLANIHIFFIIFKQLLYALFKIKTIFFSSTMLVIKVDPN